MKNGISKEPSKVVLEVFIQNNGRNMYYPHNDKAILLCSIMGKKVRDSKHIDSIKQLGFSVIQVPNPHLQETKEL